MWCPDRTHEGHRSSPCSDPIRPQPMLPDYSRRVIPDRSAQAHLCGAIYKLVSIGSVWFAQLVRKTDRLDSCKGTNTATFPPHRVRKPEPVARPQSSHYIERWLATRTNLAIGRPSGILKCSKRARGIELARLGTKIGARLPRKRTNSWSFD